MHCLHSDTRSNYSASRRAQRPSIKNSSTISMAVVSMLASAANSCVCQSGSTHCWMFGFTCSRGGSNCSHVPRRNMQQHYATLGYIWYVVGWKCFLPNSHGPWPMYYYTLRNPNHISANPAQDIATYRCSESLARALSLHKGPGLGSSRAKLFPFLLNGSIQIASTVLVTIQFGSCSAFGQSGSWLSRCIPRFKYDSEVIATKPHRSGLGQPMIWDPNNDHNTS